MVTARKTCNGTLLAGHGGKEIEVAGRVCVTDIGAVRGGSSAAGGAGVMIAVRLVQDGIAERAHTDLVSRKPIMRTRHFCILLAVLLGSMSRAGVTAQVPSPHRAHPPLAAPVLMHTCLITRDVARLVAFYREVLRTPAVMEGSEYAEFRTGVGVLAIFSAAAQERYFPGETEPASSRGVILEFEVADVDQEYARLKPLVKEWVEPPTRQPWGTRSMHFRDPDGNLVDFYMRVNG